MSRLRHTCVSSMRNVTICDTTSLETERLRHTCVSSMRNGDLIRQMCQGESVAQRDRQSSLRGDHNEKVCRSLCYAVSRPMQPERRTTGHQGCRPWGLLSVLRPVLWVFQVYSRSSRAIQGSVNRARGPGARQL